MGGCLALIAAFAQGSTRTRVWAERQFDLWWPVVSGPLFLIAAAVVICAYIAALVYTGSSKAMNRGQGLVERRVSLGKAWEIALQSRVLAPGEEDMFPFLIDQAIEKNQLSAWNGGGDILEKVQLLSYKAFPNGAWVFDEEADVYLDFAQVVSWLGPPPTARTVITGFGLDDVVFQNIDITGNTSVFDLRNSSKLRVRDIRARQHPTGDDSDEK